MNQATTETQGLDRARQDSDTVIVVDAANVNEWTAMSAAVLRFIAEVSQQYKCAPKWAQMVVDFEIRGDGKVALSGKFWGKYFTSKEYKIKGRANN